MNEDRHTELHYINNGFPYTATESYMEFFDGYSQVPVNYVHTQQIHDHENSYWSMNANAYKYGYSGPESTSYYDPYEVNENLPRLDVSTSTRAWQYPSVANAEDPTTTEVHSEEEAIADLHSIPEECITDNPGSSSPQDVWQDDVDPDNMTYEELLDLGEAVGTESRGLSEELISMLPTSKCKFGGFFSRKSGERCVICQMRYKRGEKQTKLPCKHTYHSECITKWLVINKVCPVCNNEVFGEESKD
ncbi:E3 ubiquitin-protein ligase BIG BROTHER [Linum grandiflorum]